MKNKIAFAWALIFLWSGVFKNLLADRRTEAGLTLLEPGGARAAALGEAFASMSDDITAFHYNPASLQTLKTGQASFLFQRGIGEDSYGHFMIGSPGAAAAFGLSVGYYNSGTFDVFDGTNQRSVTGQKDLTIGIGAARNMGPVALGVSGKYLSSELAEQTKAMACMGDVGLHVPLQKQIQLGAAVQNLGGRLRYDSQSDDLPRMARLGLAWIVVPQSYRTTLLVEGVYHINDREYLPAVGIETLVGPLALRAGYHAGSDLTEFTFGTGFLWGVSSLDYAFGLAQELNSSHRISLSTRFGGSQAQTAIVQKKPEANSPLITFQQRPVYEIKRAEGENPPARIYFVRPGDTLKSIAKAVYGREQMWDEIYRANQHLLNDPENLTPGQKILLPAQTR